MPSNYAHYRFGGLVLGSLEPELRSPIQRFRRVFDVGLHGPDLLFYCNPFWDNAAGQIGSRLHQKTGREFFTTVCELLKQNPSETAVIYLFGLLGHYCLDSVCHPYINERHASGQARHTELETDFDRHLLRLDGKIPPHLQCINEHMHLTRGECVTVSQFLAPASPSQISSGIRNMRIHTKLLAHKNRTLLEAILKLTNENVQDHVMMSKPNPRCEQLHPELMALYNTALERYPRLLQQLISHINDGTPLGEDFNPIFG